MKTKIIQKITPHIFEDDMIIAFSLEWIKQFKTVPEFEVFIDGQGRLHLQSIQKIKQGENVI